MGVLDILFPKVCFGCGKEGVYLCPDCLEKESLNSQFCPRCLRLSDKGITHRACRQDLGLDGLISFWRYRGAVRKAILTMKYKFASDIALELGEHLSGALKSRPNFIKGSKVLIPIPVFKNRANWRGFNQAEVIGKTVAKDLGWKFKRDILIKVKSTAPQTGLSRKEREENLRESFEVNRNVLISDYPDIIILDDIWTTGSTLKEAVKALKRAGAKKVWGLALSRG